ncbi:MAG: glycosyltransferase [Vicinamibacterales bacterium]|nr:glycosyltransferase [Vicinamibacterales bacterium]
MKRVLMIAFHFPPLAGSSGIQRTLRFARHLPAFGWQPLVLTAMPGAYERIGDDLDQDLPAGLVVRRALAFDAARHLSFRGRHTGLLARPDRWMTWQFDAVRVGSGMIREFRPDVLWSTYPIATAHLIAEKLHRRYKVPWIADFRDPMAQVGYPADPKTRAAFERIEEVALTNAALSVFTAPGAAREYRARYPKCSGRVRVIENGYDEESFLAGETDAAKLGPLTPGAATLLHSGIVYSSERDPSHLMQALSDLKRAGAIDGGRLRVRFRAPLHDNLLISLARRFNIEDIVEVLPPVPYREALVEMLRADALLVLQASNCNLQIPAKLYEYFRARRPLIILTDPDGDTAKVALDAGIARVARLDRADDIAALIDDFLEEPRFGSGLLPSEDAVRAASREGRAEALAGLLSEAALSSSDRRNFTTEFATQASAGVTMASTLNPLVSVVVPTYNCEKYLSAALDRVLSQDYAPFEVVVVDDGSTDHTLDVLATYENRVRVFRQSNRGPAAARNVAVREARGEFLAFVDGDDLWLPGKLSAQMAYLEKNPESKVVYGSWYEWYPDKDGSFPEQIFEIGDESLALEEANSGWVYSKLLMDSIIHIISAVIDRSVYDAVNGFDESLESGSDYDFWLRVSRNFQVAKLRRNVAVYRQNPASITSFPRKDDNAYRLLRRAIDTYGLEDGMGNGVDSRMFARRLSSLAFMHGYLHYRKGDPQIASSSFARAWRENPLYWKAAGLAVAAGIKSRLIKAGLIQSPSGWSRADRVRD